MPTPILIRESDIDKALELVQGNENAVAFLTGLKMCSEEKSKETYDEWIKEHKHLEVLTLIKLTLFKTLRGFCDVSNAVINDAEDHDGDGVCEVSASLLLSLRSHMNGAEKLMRDYYSGDWPNT